MTQPVNSWLELEPSTYKDHVKPDCPLTEEQLKEYAENMVKIDMKLWGNKECSHTQRQNTTNTHQ